MNYDEDKLANRFMRMHAAARGTRLHKLAMDLIRERVLLEDNTKTLNRYVNDAIRWRLRPEQMLFVSLNCFGTADAIGFDKSKMVVRVSDLKTGEIEASFKQLEGYLAMFCIEYGLRGKELKFRPVDLTMEMRIYQNDDVKFMLADPVEITRIMSVILRFDPILDELREEVKW